MAYRLMDIMVSAPGCGAHPAAWRAQPPPHAPSLAWFRSLVMLAEQACLDAVLFGAHPWGPALSATGLVQGMQPDTMPLVAALASTGRHVGLGAAVGLDRAEPFNIARSFAGADRLTGGRTIWITGLGAPGERAANFGHATPLDAAQRYARAQESILVVRKLWDSWEDEAVVLDKPAGLFTDPDRVHRIAHAGAYFSVRGPLNAPRPLQGHPLVVQSDASPAGLALAAGTADFFIATQDTPAQVRQIKQAFAGQPGPRVLATVVSLLADTQAEAEDRAAALDSWVDSRLAAAILADQGRNPAAGLAVARGLAWSMGGMPFIGTPSGFADWLSALFEDSVCDGFNLTPAVLPLDLAGFANGVAPLLQARGLMRRAYSGSTVRDNIGLPRPHSQYAKEHVA